MMWKGEGGSQEFPALQWSACKKITITIRTAKCQLSTAEACGDSLVICAGSWNTLHISTTYCHAEIPKHSLYKSRHVPWPLCSRLWGSWTGPAHLLGAVKLPLQQKPLRQCQFLIRSHKILLKSRETLQRAWEFTGNWHQCQCCFPASGGDGRVGNVMAAVAGQGSTFCFWDT